MCRAALHCPYAECKGGENCPFKGFCDCLFVFQRVCDCSVSSFKEPSHKVILVPSCGNQAQEVGSRFFPACSKYTAVHRKRVAVIAFAAISQAPSTGQVLSVCVPASGVGCHYILEDEEQTKNTEDVCLCLWGGGWAEWSLPNTTSSQVSFGTSSEARSLEVQLRLWLLLKESGCLQSPEPRTLLRLIPSTGPTLPEVTGGSTLKRAIGEQHLSLLAQSDDL